jgi:hypothetical protein
MITAFVWRDQRKLQKCVCQDSFLSWLSFELGTPKCNSDDTACEPVWSSSLLNDVATGAGHHHWTELFQFVSKLIMQWPSPLFWP